MAYKLEKENIQYRGFRNTIDENGEVVGFEFRVRSAYYRGVWLSQIRVGSVVVDDETFTPDSGLVTWTIGGVEYTPAEMKENNKAFWSILEPAIIKVKKPGGLKQGYHDVKIRFNTSASYMPPEMDQFVDADDNGFSMGGPKSKVRRMLIV